LRGLASERGIRLDFIHLASKIRPELLSENALMNIIEPILFQCKLNPQALAICVPGGRVESVNYVTLGRFIGSAARMAGTLGLAPGSVVASYTQDTILHAALMLGVLGAGLTSKPLGKPALDSGPQPDAILTDVPERFSADAKIVRIDPSWFSGEGAAIQAYASGAETDAVRWSVKSGTIALSHRLLAERLANDACASGPRFMGCSRFFCDFGVATPMGMHYTLSLLSRGATIVFLGPDPADILQAFDLYKIQGMATSTAGLGEFVKFFEADAAFEASFDHIICHGAALERELSFRARARMCQNLYRAYGFAETGAVAFAPASVTEQVVGSVGYTQPGVTVEAVDDTGTVLPPLRDGALRIRSAQSVRGYAAPSQEGGEMFRDGAFWSGDIGHVTPDGLIVVTTSGPRWKEPGPR
jgi:acyl-coenzyme A synthetase/AMP-(fatty) acid ligase